MIGKPRKLLQVMSMAISPETLHEKHFDFRAPPPSPIATGRRSSFTNEDVLSEFLEHSLRVPDLILPDKIFPRQKIIETPPKIDFNSLNSSENDSGIDKIMESISRIGCFQLVNHGIPHDLIQSVMIAGAGVFQVMPENRAAVTRSSEKAYGFEEVHVEDEGEMSEEFVWCRDESLKLEMEGILPLGYSKFSDKMESLSTDIEKVGTKILGILSENFLGKSMYGNERQMPGGSICYLYKHNRHSTDGDCWVNSLKYDVMRMLIRGSDYSSALCFHLCNGSSEFHVYSKKGWVSFCPEPDSDALIVTVGDKLQAWSGGLYKQVIGRPIFKGENHEDCISMAFLFSPPSIIITNDNNSSSKIEKMERTISLGQQAIFAIFLTLVYHFLIYIFKKF